MRKRLASVLAAIIVIVIGVLLVLNATGVYKFELFPGWWTLFLIIPSLIAMIRSGINPGNMIFLGAGVLLLLNTNGLLRGVNIWILLLGMVVVFVGLGMLFRRPKKGPKARPPFRTAAFLPIRRFSAVSVRRTPPITTAALTSHPYSARLKSTCLPLPCWPTPPPTPSPCLPESRLSFRTA